MNWVEIVGYSGSALVALSLMMRNIRKLRQINLIGASTFACYGYLVDAYPVLVLNGFIALTDVYYLFNMYRQKDCFSLMPVLDNRHKYLDKFIQFYKKDILKFFPDFNIDIPAGANCFFILRNLMPVGLFIYDSISETEIKILIDYAIPDYRDLKNAQFVYSAESELLRNLGIRKLTAESRVAKHRKYLDHMGFVNDKKNPDFYYKSI